MKHWYQKPHPLISDYVRAVLVIDGSLEPDPSSPPLVTNGMAALFYRDGNLTLFGRSVPSECWHVGNHQKIAAYFFTPFAAPVMFNMDAKKLEVVELGSIDINAIDDLLIGKINPNCKIIKYATDQIMLDPSTEILPAIVKKLDINERTFQRIFKKYVGITASQYRRICQFQSTFTELRTQNFQSLTD